MKNKHLIIFLIRQDMIHSRLTMGLEKLGLKVDDEHSLEIMNKVAELMEVEQDSNKDKWYEIYMAFRDLMYANCQSNEWEHKLDELAERCYNQLELFNRIIPV